MPQNTPTPRRQSGRGAGGRRERGEATCNAACLVATQVKPSKLHAFCGSSSQAKPSQAKHAAAAAVDVAVSVAARNWVTNYFRAKCNRPQGESSGRGRGRSRQQTKLSKLPQLTMRCSTSWRVQDVCVCGSCLSLSLSSLSLLCLACFLPLLLPYPLHLGRKCKPFSFYFQPGAA